MTIPTHREPTHPGEILLEDFLKPKNLTQSQVAEELGIPLNRVNELIRGKRGITADTALRLAKRFKTSAMFWMNLQSAVDLYRARQALVE
jgi:addiction module HigA family antidote